MLLTQGILLSSSLTNQAKQRISYKETVLVNERTVHSDWCQPSQLCALGLDKSSTFNSSFKYSAKICSCTLPPGHLKELTSLNLPPIGMSFWTSGLETVQIQELRCGTLQFLQSFTYEQIHPLKRKRCPSEVTKPISLPWHGPKIQQNWEQVVCLNLFDQYYCRNIYTALQIATTTIDCYCCYHYYYFQSHELIRSRQLTDGLRANTKTLKLPSNPGSRNCKIRTLRDYNNRN